MASPDITGIRVLDGHNDLPWHHREIAGYDLDRCDIALEQPELHTDLPRMRAGGLAAQLWSVWVPCELPGEAAVTATHEQVDFVEAVCARYEEMELARTAADVERVWEQGRHAALLGMEEAGPGARRPYRGSVSQHPGRTGSAQRRVLESFSFPDRPTHPWRQA